MPPRDDELFEDFLRRFEPLRPRELPAAVFDSAGRWQVPTAIASVLVLATVIALWTGSRLTTPNQRAETSAQTDPVPVVTIGQVNELLRQNPARLDAELAEASRHLLPDVRQPSGLLHVLARD
jgi:hypothetical protein